MPISTGFRLPGIRAFGPTGLVLIAMGCAVPARPVAQVPPADVAVEQLPLGSGVGDENGILSGLVVDVIGRPQAGALVRVGVSDEVFGTRLETRTERDGTFTLRGLQPGRTYVVVASDDEPGTGPVQGRAAAAAPNRNVVIQMFQAYPRN